MNYWFDPKHVEGVYDAGAGCLHVTLRRFLNLRTAVASAKEAPWDYVGGRVDYRVYVGESGWLSRSMKMIGQIDKTASGRKITANILDAKTIIIEIGAEPKRQELIRGEIQ